MPDKTSVDRIDEILRVVFKELKAMGGRARVKDLLTAAEPKLKLTDYEKERTRTGAVRWNTHVRFYTVDCVKAGFLSVAFVATATRLGPKESRDHEEQSTQS